MNLEFRGEVLARDKKWKNLYRDVFKDLDLSEMT